MKTFAAKSRAFSKKYLGKLLTHGSKSRRARQAKVQKMINIGKNGIIKEVERRMNPPQMGGEHRNGT